MTQDKLIRLLVAEDQPAVRRSIRELVSQTDDILVAGEACNGVEAVEKVRAEAYDLVVLDITMPLMNGFDVLKDLKRERPDLPVLILSIHPADQYKDRALELGAAAYISKERAADDLIDEVRRAVASNK